MTWQISPGAIMLILWINVTLGFRRRLCFTGMLRGIGRYPVTDVSGWPIGPLDFLSPEDGTDRLF